MAADELFLSAVTVGEIQAGIEFTREQDACDPRKKRPESARRTPSQPEYGGRIACDQLVWCYDRQAA